MFATQALQKAVTLNSTPAYNFGANLKQLKIRMKTFSSIKKITKAMKMVAAAKMKVEERRLRAGEHFGKGTVQKFLDNETYLQKKKQGQNIKKSLLVPVTSDKGLCGSVNTQIVRYCKYKALENRDAFRIVTIGDKGTAGLVRPFPDILTASLTQLTTPISFYNAASMAHNIVE